MPAKKKTPVRSRLKTGQAIISSSTKRGSDPETHAPELRQDFAPRETDGTTVCVHLASTTNLGDYNSGKVGVIVTLPCNRDEIQETGDQAYQEADELLMRVNEQFYANQAQA